MAYGVEIARLALQQLRALPRAIQQRLGARIGNLGHDPHPPGSRKLLGQNDYRIRVGDYRIIYEIDSETMSVTVAVVPHRRDAYRQR